MKAAAIALATLVLAAPTVVGADATALGISYICGAEHPGASIGPVDAVMLTGVGNGASPADTANREAQAWFNEGLNLYHAFNHREASAALAKAAALDPTCALCEWGVALGLGQTLNYAITPQQTAEALTHVERALTLVKPSDVRAAGLIAALQVRYGKDTPPAQRDTLYEHAMDDLVRRYPGDDEIAVLAVHALLIPARHDDYSGVPRSEEILKTVLARHPDDTAAIHYEIHATEFAGHPADALPYAEKLATLAPGASHLVHMAAHTLMHVGQYERVATIDAAALQVDADVQSRLHYAGPLSVQMYYLHNYTFGLAGALMAGDGRLSLKYAEHVAVAFPDSFDKGAVAFPAGTARSEKLGDRRTTATARSLVAYGRYAPDKALALRDDPTDPLILRIYRHYARGEALAARGDGAGVIREAEAIDGLGAQASKTELASLPITDISANVLKGRAALLRNDPEKAAGFFTKAAERQERVYPVRQNFDPPPWWYPARRSVAAADLKAGHNADAVREATLSLRDWPADALALRVLGRAEARLGQTRAARLHLEEAQKAWRGDLRNVPIDLT